MEKKKVGFASGIGFILAAAGSAVGLGNLWAFPYKTSANGGAAFVILYILSVLFVGLVTMLAEIFIGKRSQANPVTAYKNVGKKLGWIGLLGILIPSVIAIYYSVLGGYTVKFSLNSFVGNAGNFEIFAGNVGDVILVSAIFIVFAMVIIMGGVGLMFKTLPLVFESMGGFGQVVSFFFFAMVVIAAVTSVISLLEVTTQFVIQKGHVDRKKSTAIVAIICFAISIPVGISLGKVLNGDNSFTLFGQDLLDLMDIVTNTVLMPVCALLGCICVGWIIGAKNAVSEIEASGTRLGRFGKIFAVMVKYITPLLIAIVEIFGIFDLILPAGENGRTFDPDGLAIVLVSAAIILICIVVYFTCFYKKETGTNEDEKIAVHED